MTYKPRGSTNISQYLRSSVVVCDRFLEEGYEPRICEPCEREEEDPRRGGGRGPEESENVVAPLTGIIYIYICLIYSYIFLRSFFPVGNLLRGFVREFFIGQRRRRSRIHEKNCFTGSRTGYEFNRRKAFDSFPGAAGFRSG